MQRIPFGRTVLFGALVAAAGAAQAQSGLFNVLRGAQLLAPAAAVLAPAVVEATQDGKAPAEGAHAPIPQATPAEIEAALAAPVAPLEGLPAPTGAVNLKGKRFYVAEYRVLFEIGGTVSASTRGGYLPGRDYGATRVTVNYQVPEPNVAAMQMVTDKAYADFLARLEASGAKPEAADGFVRENGAIYDFVEADPRAPVVEENNGRKYLVFVPTGTRRLNRGFIGLGAGNIGKRIEWSKTNMEAISVGMAVNLAAQESSGNGSSIFRRGSSANASAAMEVAIAPKSVLLQSHAMTQMVNLGGPVAVPGQFANMRETGGYATRKDGVVQAINVLGAMTMGVAGNNSKKVEMVLDVDNAAMSRMALQGLVAVNQGVAAQVK